MLPDPDTTPSLPSGTTHTRYGAGHLTRRLPTASGGNAPLAYSVSENDPHGSITSFNSSSRRIIVLIPSVPATLTFVYRVEDADGDFDTSTYTFKTLTPPPPPTVLPRVRTKVSGAWRTASVRTKVAGSWRTATVWTKVAGVWERAEF